MFVHTDCYLPCIEDLGEKRITGGEILASLQAEIKGNLCSTDVFIYLLVSLLSTLTSCVSLFHLLMNLTPMLQKNELEWGLEWKFRNQLKEDYNYKDWRK